MVYLNMDQWSATTDFNVVYLYISDWAYFYYYAIVIPQQQEILWTFDELYHWIPKNCVYVTGGTHPIATWKN